MSNRLRIALLAWVVLAGLLVTVAVPTSAQTTTGAIRGYITTPDGAALPGAEITAQNLATGARRVTTSQTDGMYLLPGLVPGIYEVAVRYIGWAPQSRRIQVQVGSTLLASFALAQQAVRLAALEVVAVAPAVETRTSEVATVVSQEAIVNLPTSDRNFLDLAVLAPGVSLSGTRVDDTRRTLSFGAQGAEQINVFIDGASYKNDILKGGVVGQDASRGNPFPRNAVEEFRVITQNFKAEYQKASSGIIAATTRSGTNNLEGSIFFGYVDQHLVSLDTFQSVDKANNPTAFTKPKYDRYQFGFNVGGPIIRDKLHAFLSYEGNLQTRNYRVNIVPPTGYPAIDSVDFAQYNGAFESPFRSHLGFGKLTFEASENSSFELSYNLRTEYDIRDFGGYTSYQSSTKFNNDVHTAILKHKYFKNSFLNEATVYYQYYQYNPVPNTQPLIASRLYGFGCCATIGSNISFQKFRQQRISLRNDVTYSGFQLAGSHIFKAGANFDLSYYDINKRNSENPRFVYESWWFSFQIPERVEFQAGDPNFSSNNTQLGAFIQDDWSPLRRLTFNLGVRWDYESGMMNYGYVTPEAIVDSLTKYRDSLFLPLDQDRYFTDGTQRSRWLGAIQPRVGVSFQVDNKGRTTVFGGWGIFYDRSLYDMMIEESFAEQHPSYLIRFRPAGDNTDGRLDWRDAYLQFPDAFVEYATQNQATRTPEVKLLPNDLRPPKSQQISAGVRQILGPVNISVAYTGVRSWNVFTFYWANSNFTCANRDWSCFRTRSVPGFSTILYANYLPDSTRTWYDALQVQIERPYRPTGAFAWGGGIAYSFAKRQTRGYNDDFSFPNPVDYPKQVRNDERHRIVANAIFDLPWLWGIQFSGLYTLGSGVKYDVGDRFGGPGNPLVPGGFDPPAYSMLDLRVRKDFPTVYGTRLGVTVDLFNAFNTQNMGCYNTWNAANAPYTASCTISDPRRVQVGAQYDF